jgi:hydrogenase maturation protein HypF
MRIFETSFKSDKIILALGADSAGGFSLFQKGKIYYQAGFGDLLNDDNFLKYNNSITVYLRKNKLKPDIVLVDLHPLFRTVELGEKLAKKYQAKLIKIQHHLAHIFSAYGEYLLTNKKEAHFVGLALDGTGFGYDERIWGGEVFAFQFFLSQPAEIKRIGHLENQVLIGGERAIIEPARILIAILSNFLSKEEVFALVKKYYTDNEFELLFNQLQTRFNCIESSSTGRVLDAVAVLLNFIDNKSNYKHQPVELLEKNSTSAFEIEPEIFFDKNERMFILNTTKLFQYLLKNIKKDKKGLAATAQVYLAKGLLKIINLNGGKIFLGGGLVKNKIITEYLSGENIFFNKEISSGDEGLSWGQLCFYFLNKRN